MSTVKSGDIVKVHYTGKLDNVGEQLVLIDQSGAVILDFTYNDHDDWPAGADGASPAGGGRPAGLHPLLGEIPAGALGDQAEDGGQPIQSSRQADG